MSTAVAPPEHTIRDVLQKLSPKNEDIVVNALKLIVSYDPGNGFITFKESKNASVTRKSGTYDALVRVALCLMESDHTSMKELRALNEFHNRALKEHINAIKNLEIDFGFDMSMTDDDKNKNKNKKRGGSFKASDDDDGITTKKKRKGAHGQKVASAGAAATKRKKGNERDCQYDDDPIEQSPTEEKEREEEDPIEEAQSDDPIREEGGDDDKISEDLDDLR
jgi:hypothetical protein